MAETKQKHGTTAQGNAARDELLDPRRSARTAGNFVANAAGIGLWLLVTAIIASPFGQNGSAGEKLEYLLLQWVVFAVVALGWGRVAASFRESPFVVLGRFISPWLAWSWLLAVGVSSWALASVLLQSLPGFHSDIMNWKEPGSRLFGELDLSERSQSWTLLTATAIIALGLTVGGRTRRFVQIGIGAFFLVGLFAMLASKIEHNALVSESRGFNFESAVEFDGMMLATTALIGWWLWAVGIQSEASFSTSGVKKALGIGLLLILAIGLFSFIGAERFIVAHSSPNLAVFAVLTAGFMALVGLVFGMGLSLAELANLRGNAKGRIVGVVLSCLSLVPAILDWDIAQDSEFWIQPATLVCSVGLVFGLLLLFCSRRAWVGGEFTRLSRRSWVLGLALVFVMSLVSAFFILRAFSSGSQRSFELWLLLMGLLVLLLGGILLSFLRREKRAGKARPSLLG